MLEYIAIPILALTVCAYVLSNIWSRQIRALALSLFVFAVVGSIINSYVKDTFLHKGLVTICAYTLISSFCCYLGYVISIKFKERG
jgi:hypothetical protein